MFSTAFALRADADRRVLEWANAGHPPGLFLRADASGRNAERLDATTPMLGVQESGEFRCAPESAPLANGDRVVVVTDERISIAGVGVVLVVVVQDQLPG